VSRHTEVPTEIGQLRILISQGDVREVRQMLDRVSRDGPWQSWMRALELDYSDLEALALIREQDFQHALNVLEASTQSEPGTRRPYLTGYVLFQQGNAEAAVKFFENTRFRLYDVVFPFHSDPILFVQSIFYLGEAALARGDSETALDYYRGFLAYWGTTDWDLQAVDRARSKVESLSSPVERHP
jgi:tetratricopeptide (TPR) repeat protein